MEIRHLEATDIGLIAEIDRSEELDTMYGVADGRLVTRSVATSIPTWDPVGTGEHSVAGVIDFWGPVVTNGAALLGAFDGEDVMGLAIVDGAYRPGTAWLAFMYVSRRDRRSGVASAMWEAAEAVAKAAGSPLMYVSAAPTGSAVGFYISRGCRLAEESELIDELYRLEPDDIHLVCAIAPW